MLAWKYPRDYSKVTSSFLYYFLGWFQDISYLSNSNKIYLFEFKFNIHINTWVDYQVMDLFLLEEFVA
jgi:hypothetical protein